MNAGANGANILGGRSIVLVGMMGAGKTVVGRNLARALGLGFRDSDHEIEAAARMSIQDLFALYGEPEFRALERRVIRRLLLESPIVLAAGGGAFANEATRSEIATSAVSVWLRADLDTLFERVSRRSHRPLLKVNQPRATLAGLLATREPIYAEADITVSAPDQPLSEVVGEVINALHQFQLRSVGFVSSCASARASRFARP